MNIIKYALFIVALSLPVTNTHALEWVDYGGTIPDNAVSVNEGTEDRPICRNNERIGVVNDSGRCRSVKIGSGVSKKDDFQILVDTYNVYEAVQADEDMYTQTDLDDAVTEATEDMYTQAEYDAATDGMYTQAEYDAATDCEMSFEWDWREFEDRAGVTVYNDGGIPFYSIDGNVSDLDGDYLPLLRVNGEQWGFQVAKGGNTTRYWQIRMRPPTIGTCTSYAKYGCEY